MTSVLKRAAMIATLPQCPTFRLPRRLIDILSIATAGLYVRTDKNEGSDWLSADRGVISQSYLDFQLFTTYATLEAQGLTSSFITKFSEEINKMYRGTELVWVTYDRDLAHDDLSADFMRSAVDKGKCA